MKTIRISLFITILFCSISTYAQTPFCGFDMHMQDIYDADTSGFERSRAAHAAAATYYRKHHTATNYLPSHEPCTNCLIMGSSCPKANYLLPVVVHVIHLPSDALGQGSNITDVQIEDQIDILNAIYRNKASANSVNTGIQFCLAKKKPDGSSFNGINRIASDSSNMHRNNQSELTSLIHYSTDQYINIYIVNGMLDTSSNPTTVAGFATHPNYGSRANDVVVIRADWFGDYSVYNTLNSQSRGKTLVHEIGHYLGLYHPFRGSCQGADTSTCATQGDMCCDVPQVAAPDVGGCGPSNTCTDTPNDSNDQKENHMDYALETCRTRFTPDQADLMYTTLHGVRSSLWQPSNVNNLQLTCCVNAIAFSGQADICYGTGDSLHITAYKYDSTNYSWKLYKNGSLDTTINNGNSHKLTLLRSTGLYDLELVMTGGGSTVNRRIDSAFEILACDSLLASTQGSWYFGKYAGMRFYKNGLVLRDNKPFLNSVGQNQISSDEGTISVCDDHGNLLFYGGGDEGNASDNWDFRIYDVDYKEVENSPILGNGSAHQAGVTFLNPSDTNQYYIFNILSNEREPNDGVYYSVFDKSITSGGSKGDLIDTLKNTEVLDSNNSTIIADEMIIAVPGCEDSTYWVLLTSDYGSIIHKIFVNSNGVSYRGHDTIGSNTGAGLGSIKASPDGRFLALHNKILRFCGGDGSITPYHKDSTVEDGATIACSFSPDSKLLYRIEREKYSVITGWDTIWGIPTPIRVFYEEIHLMQLDVYSSNITTTKKEVAEVPSYYEFMQLGPDEKIYISSTLQQYASVINKPNTVIKNGNDCELVEEGVILSRNGVGGTCMSGLPNQIDARPSNLIEANIGFVRSECYTVQFWATNCCGTSYKWFFGDGDSSALKEPNHVYATNDSFAVVLIVDGDTARTTVITRPSSQPLSISGPSEMCDTANVYTYQTEYNSNWIYDWSLTNASLVFQERHVLELKGNGSGSVTVVVKDESTGCRDTATLAIGFGSIIYGNKATYAYSRVCNPSDITLSCTYTTGGDGTFDYQWYKEESSGSLSLIIGATSSTFEPTEVGIFYRKVLSGGCESWSDKSVVETLPKGNTIALITSLCTVGDEIRFSGNQVTSDVGYTTTYLWEYSTDSTTWLSTDSTTQNLTFQQNSQTQYYRRKASFTLIGYPQCSKYSKVIKVEPRVWFVDHPQDIYICSSSTENWTFNATVNNPDAVSLDTNFEYKNAGGSNWYVQNNTSLEVSNPLSYSANTDNNANGDSVRFSISVSTCGTIYSNTAQIYTVSGTSSIISYQGSQTVSPGESAKFFVKLSATNPPDSTTWQVNDFGSGQWSDISSTYWDTLEINPTAICQDSNQYRLAATNPCGTVYSTPVYLNVSDLSDLWMRDSDADTGAIPNISWSLSTITKDIFESPDLWNRKDDNTGLSPENAEYKNLGPNYARVRVRNKGNDTSEIENLFLYWTIAATGEVWDWSWKSSGISTNFFYNRDSSKWFPMGKQINNDPITIPRIAPGQDTILSYPWYPPNPNWYHGKTGAFNRYTDGVNICLLARIEKCEEPPHRMEIDEVFNQHVSKNVINNNNIVTRNFYVFDSDPQNVVKPILVRFGNYLPTPEDIDFGFRLGDSSILTDWDIRLDFDDDIWVAWTNNGSQGSGFTIIPGEQAINVTSDNLRMNGFLLTASEMGFIHISLVAIDPENTTEGTFEMFAEQYRIDTITPEGGVIFQLNIEEELPTSMPHNEQESVSKPVVDWGPEPNPAQTGMAVTFNLKVRRFITIDIYDALGRKVTTKARSRYMDGANSVYFDVHDWPTGVYYVHFRYDMYSEAKKIIIRRD